MSIGNKETKSVEGLLTFLGERPVVLDIGANKAQWADIILNRFDDKCTIHLFEPNLMLLNYCRIKYEYRKNIIYNEVAAYHTETELDFFYFENYNNELSSLYKGDWDDLPMKQKKVKAVSLYKYCADNKLMFVDYIKIDAEGSDVDVLFGCSWLLKTDSVGIIQIEYGEHYKRCNHSIKEVFDICGKYGYSIYRYVDSNYELVEPFDDTWEAEDFFLTKFNIHNYSYFWNKEFINNTIDIPKFDFALEVGCYEGFTTKFICLSLLNKGGRIICVDPLEDYYTKEDTEHKEMFKNQYQRFLRTTHGLPVELIRKTSEIALLELHEFRFDFIYIDADHREMNVFNDGCNSVKICKEGGFILFDDYEWREETKRGIDKFLEIHSGHIEIISKGYQVLIKKLSDI